MAMTSAIQTARPRAFDRRWLVPTIAAPAILAWAVLWWMSTSTAGRFFRHDDLANNQAVLPTVLIGWIVMIAAMMLPTTTPLLAAFRTVVGARPDRGRLAILLITGYGAVWTLVGAVAIGLDDALHLVIASPAEGETSWIAIGVLGAAGLYQFTPLKKRCLSSFRSPLVFVSQRWHGGDPSWAALGLGAAYGWFCVGCCWSLMMVMFAAGMGSFGWMIALAALMAVEKNVARAAYLAPLIGAGLVLSAVLLARP